MFDCSGVSLELLHHVRSSQTFCQLRDAVQSVVPECVDFYTLATSGCDHTVPHLCIHPGELDAILAGCQQSIFLIDADAVADAATIPLGNFKQCVEQGQCQLRILAGMGVGKKGLNEPQRGVDRVVLRLRAVIREAVGQHATIDEPGEGVQYVVRVVESSGRKRQPRY